MKKFAIIGNPIGHSLSPTLHNYWFRKHKITARYDLLEIQENQIEKTIDDIRKRKLEGINVTIPYKQKVIPYIDKFSISAKESNSVNTISLDHKNNIVGDNTDIYGLLSGYLKQISDKPKKLKALIIGAGGVAPSVYVALKQSFITDITLINRTYEKSIFLKRKFTDLKILQWSEIQKIIKNFDIIINATSLGLKNSENFNFLFEDFKNSLIYIDTIYNPMETKMIKHLKGKGVKTFNGLDMFVYQGQKSFYLWNKINPEIDNNLIDLLVSKIK